GEKIIAICNFTPVVRNDYRIGVPEAGVYKEIFNSDADIYGGSHVINAEPMTSEPVNWNNRSQSILLTLPP
ncbi:MAG: alpha amylase C-terminal domain-containing protein, partial [Anaerolineales bacterium]|nr:alpha amylase C-terminal domain-containing protein [Anaerolineales bacterium]